MGGTAHFPKTSHINVNGRLSDFNPNLTPKQMKLEETTESLEGLNAN